MKKILSLFVVLNLLMINSVFADRIAIIGGGAAGLVSTWLLEQDHDVTLYEAQGRLGGHADTVDVMVDGAPVAVDAGAEFFNEKFYPHFMRLLRHFRVPLKSYTLVTNFYRTDINDQIILPPRHDGTTEWGSLTPGNIRRSYDMKLIIDKGRDIIDLHDTTTRLETFINTLKLNKGVEADFVYPLLAAAWGVSINEVKDFTAYNAVNYLVQGYDTTNYQWLEVTGGLKKYVEAVSRSLRRATVKLNSPVMHIIKNDNSYTLVTLSGDVQEFDQIIFATNAKVASELLAELPDMGFTSRLLGKVKYFDTKIAIHSDPRFMPADKSDWRVVNIRYDGHTSAATMYKAWASKTPIFKSWITYDVRNPKDNGSALPNNLYALITYQHPIADGDFYNAQETIKALQGKNKIWFVGMWANDGDSHESAITSAMKVTEMLDPESDRLKILAD